MMFDLNGSGNEYFVLSEYYSDSLPCNASQKTLVIIYVYYIVSFERVCMIREMLEGSYDYYIITSNKKMAMLLDEKNCSGRTIMKPNRGRDISALLVTVKDLISNYKYFCFVHDKQYNDKSYPHKYKNDVSNWSNDLWENSIASRHFINNVLNIFENRSDLGLLCVPGPFGMHLNHWYNNGWADNYSNVINLAKLLDIHISIDQNRPSPSLGTVFWARTDALKKLFRYNWKYDDFPEEPLASDGTISHAIERILPYVASDAGYNTGIIINEKNAAHRLAYIQHYSQKIFYISEKYLGIGTFSDIEHFSKKEKEIIKFAGCYKKIWIYGAGAYGVRWYYMLLKNGIITKGFVVSDKNYRTLNGSMQTSILDDIHIDNDTGIIVAAGKKTSLKLKEELEKRNIVNYIGIHDVEDL